MEATMGTLNKPMASSLKFNDFIAELATRDLSDEVSRRRSRHTEGPSVAWLIGHLIHHRHVMLELLGRPRANPDAERFAEAGATDGKDYPSIDELRAAWTELSTLVGSAVEEVSDEQLQSEMSADSPHAEKTLIEALSFFVWHEPYHLGQMGMLRAQLGLTPTATLAVEATKVS
jgi:uncharacterized damage-inducible protein DinB